MSYRSHFCDHGPWQHVCSGNHAKSHRSTAIRCALVWGDDPTAVALFELHDGEIAS